jgi:hypothetical protein
MLSHTAYSRLLKSIDKSVAILDQAKDRTLGEELLRMAILRVQSRIIALRKKAKRRR